MWRIQLFQRMTGPGDSHESRKCDERRIVLPPRQGGERIGAHDEKEVRSGVLLTQVAERVDGVRRSPAPQVDVAHLEPGIARGSGVAHREPVLARRYGSWLQRLGIRGDEKHGIEAEDKMDL